VLTIEQTKSPAIAEKADRTALRGIVVQHADDGYSRRGNFGGSLCSQFVAKYSPDKTNVHGSRITKFGGSWSV